MYDRRRTLKLTSATRIWIKAEAKNSAAVRDSETKGNTMASNTEIYYVLFDEIEEAFVGTEFLGVSYREDGEPLRERVAFFPDYTDKDVVHFRSPEGANNWLAPTGGYDRSRATLIRVSVEYTAEAVGEPGRVR